MNHSVFLANRNKERDLGRCRELLGVAHPLPESTLISIADAKELMLQLTGVDLTKCPCCPRGNMVVVEQIPMFSAPRPGRRISNSEFLDSS